MRRFVLGAAALTTTLGGYALVVEPNRLEVRTEVVALPSWRGVPLRVALVADLHVGCPSVDVARAAEIARRVQDEHPDVVLLLGDYQVNGVLGGERVPVSAWAPAFGAVDAPLGVWAVLGNHDWWNDADATREALQDAGIAVLDNEGALIRAGASGVWLAGVGDALTRHAAPEVALAGAPADADILAMTHGPEVAATLGGRADLLVAGHTHGGQVNLPSVTTGLLGPMSWYGSRAVAGQPVWVTGGIGTSVLPIRFGRPPEVVVLEVRATPR